MSKRIGIFGGTFNPVHTGHLLVASAAVEAFHLDRVLFMPCAVSPYKIGEKSRAMLAPAADRLAMLRLSIEADPRFEICGLELARGGVSYAIDSVKELRRQHPADTLVFIMGMDSLRGLAGWKDAVELTSLCEIAVLARPGAPMPRPEELGFPEPLAQRLLAQVAEGRLCDISSSEIRRRVAEGRPIRYLVSASVEKYIRAKGLYR